MPAVVFYPVSVKCYGACVCVCGSTSGKRKRNELVPGIHGCVGGTEWARAGDGSMSSRACL